MNTYVARQLPVLTSACATLLVVAFGAWNPSALRRLEAITYDMRVRWAAASTAPSATNLGFAFISDVCIARVADGNLGYRHGLYWPRHVYGRVVDELTAQGVRAIAFDVLLPLARPDHAPVRVAGPAAREAERFEREIHPKQTPLIVDDALILESDDYFAWQMRRSGRVILAVERDVPALPLFATNAMTLADVSADRDGFDGVLRRARPFTMHRRWHPAFLGAQEDYGVQLDRAVVGRSTILLPVREGEPVTVEIDDQGRFALADFYGDELPPDVPAKALPFTEHRVWHMGIVLAAAELGLDLDSAIIEPRRILLAGPGGTREVPLTPDGNVLLDWSLDVGSPSLQLESVSSLLELHRDRLLGQPPETNRWHGRLVLLGSAATGNDLTDRGPTPLGEFDLYVGAHWNLANSVLTGRFVRQTPGWLDALVLVLLGVATSWLTWRLRAVQAAGAVLLLAMAYAAVAGWLYLEWRLWIPVVLPVVGAAFFQHVCLISYRVVFEEREKRKVRSVFAKVVSPNVVHELLRSKKIAFGGAQRDITVLFADVRGFTQLTDRTLAEAEAHIRDHHLDSTAAAAYLDHQARDTLNTVNLYLATVADVVKRHAGTLDKYIGDCVMAFWGAPTPNAKHALAAVEAAVDAQRAIHALNVQREAENQRRTAAGQPQLALLNLGSGLNSGVAIVGLMGSDQHILNYTVFGREVNLASRLEGVSGRGRVIIGATTYQHLLRDAPELAARCRALEPTTVKGISETLTCYEVPWRQDDQGASAPAATA